MFGDVVGPEQAEYLRQTFKDADPTEEDKGEEESSEDQDAETHLAVITKDYTLSYKDVKDHLQLRKGALAGIDRKKIARMIESGRRRLARKASSIGE